MTEPTLALTVSKSWEIRLRIRTQKGMATQLCSSAKRKSREETLSSNMMMNLEKSKKIGLNIRIYSDPDIPDIRPKLFDNIRMYLEKPDISD